MYELPPYYRSGALVTDLPTCMYKVDKIYDTGATPNSTRPKKDMSEIDDILSEQNLLLKKLNVLELEVRSLVGQRPAALPFPHPLDVVVWCSTSLSPLPLLVLYEMLRGRYRCSLSSHLHSSVITTSSTSPPASLLRHHQPPSSRAALDIIVTLVWRADITECEMILNPTKHTVVRGEVNVARFMWGLLHYSPLGAPPTFSLRDNEMMDRLALATTATHHQLLNEMESRVGSYTSLIHLVDVLVWGVATRLHPSPTKYPALVAWMERLQSQTGFSLARQYIIK